MDTKTYRLTTITYFLIAAVIGIANVAFIENITIAMAVVAFECFILIINILMRKYTNTYSLLLIFSGLCIESSLFAGTDTFYNMKNTRVLGINLVIWLLALIVVVMSLRKKRFPKSVFQKMNWFIRGIAFLVITGTIMGLFNILINDNNIRNIPNYFGEYISVFYTMALFPVLFMIATLLCIMKEPENAYKIKLSILAVFLGVSVQIVFSTLTGHRIRIAGLDGIGGASSLIIFYIPLAIAAFFYKDLIPKPHSYFYLIITSVGTVFALINNANGKLIILIILLPFIICTLANKSLKLVIIPIICIVVIFVALYILPTVNSESNYLLSKKIEEVVGIFNIFSIGWLQNMPASPRYRLLELINTLIELLNKPWCILFGKGYLGSITDHINMFVRVGGDFSEVQWSNGVFYFLHESLNLLLLNNGVLGVYMWFKTFRFGLKNYRKSFFVLFGSIWFCLTYGYSVTITGIGMSAIIIGLYDVCSLLSVESQGNENTVL